MLHHGHELDVGEAHLDDVGGELLGELEIAQARAPGPQMDFVRRHRGVVGIGLRARRHPVGVAPGVVGREHHRGRGRRVLGVTGEGVCLGAPHAIATEHGELVAGAGADVGDEQLPDATASQRTHRRAGAVPVVVIADDADTEGVGRPDGERRSADVTEDGRVGVLVGTEDGPERLVASLGDEVQIDVAERGQESIRVVDDLSVAAVDDLEPIVGNVSDSESAREDATVLVLELGAGLAVRTARDNGHALGPRAQRAHRDRAVVRVRAEDRVRVVVAPLDHTLQVGSRHRVQRRGSAGLAPAHGDGRRYRVGRHGRDRRRGCDIGLLPRLVIGIA